MVATDAVQAGQLSLTDIDGSDFFGLPLDLEPWNGMSALELQNFDIMQDVDNSGTLPLQPIDADNPTTLVSEVDDTSLHLWFLQGETWSLQHGSGWNKKTVCEFEDVITWIRSMLHCWLEKGSNSFIHSHLYQSGMPECLQDAYTTLAAYNNATPVMKPLILQIADDRAARILAQRVIFTEDAPGLLMHLARIQALYILMFISLFDKSVRSKAVVEHHTFTLRRWTLQLWEAARRYRGGVSSTKLSTESSTLVTFEAEHENAIEIWRKWILVESIRRSLLVIDLTLTVQETITTGWAECPGTPQFTAGRGLWDARSPLGWLELTQKSSLLLVSPSQPLLFISRYPPQAFDDLLVTLWTFAIGKDMAQSWIDRGTTLV